MRKINLKDYNLADTIAAIATFPARSALGVVKISGKKALPIVSKMFKPKSKKDIKKVKTYTMHYGWIMDGLNGSRRTVNKKKEKMFVDEVLVSVMRKPRSYTREDVVEISSHGGEAVLNRILEITLDAGARLALPGEFTYRALVKGRIDLLQAESVSAIIDAKTQEGLEAAAAQLNGRQSVKIKEVKEEVKELFVLTESAINFPEDDVAFSASRLRKAVEKLEKKVNDLVEGGREAKAIREGVKCVICGRANAGKSTLFNCLIRDERVIVSRLAGTTRDVVEEAVNVGGVPLRIYDTAGILEPKDPVAKKAIDKASRIFDAADLVILVLDGSRPLNKHDRFFLDKVKNKNCILAVNKIDLAQRMNLREISDRGQTVVNMSALKNAGVADLEKEIREKVYKRPPDRENMIFLNRFQQDILKETRDKISELKAFLGQGYTLDFVNLSLKECLDNLGRLGGEVVSEEILKVIFENFCIGK